MWSVAFTNTVSVCLSVHRNELVLRTAKHADDEDNLFTKKNTRYYSKTVQLKCDKIRTAIELVVLSDSAQAVTHFLFMLRNTARWNIFSPPPSRPTQNLQADPILIMTRR